MELLIENAAIIGADEFYRSTRYDLPLVVILVNSEDRRAFDILEDNIRKTDIIQQLSSESIVVFLSHTNYKESELFIEKIKGSFEFTYTVSEFKSPEDVFLRNLFINNEEKSVAI